MNKALFLILLMIISFSSFSQTETSTNNKRLKFGFNLGINYSNFVEDENLPINSYFSNDLGISFGVIAEYKVSKKLSIAPKSSLSFYGGKINFTDIVGSKSENELIPATIDFRTHFILKQNNEKYHPYLFIGPSVNINISNKDSYPTLFPTRSNFGIDFGIGIDRSFTHFSIMPELRYSYGLINISQESSIKSLKFHYVALVFNFI
jgi:hypothetical protein